MVKRLIASLFVCLAVCISVCSYAMAETEYTGTIVAGDTYAVRAACGGTVKTVDVREGDTVTETTGLITLEAEKVFAGSDGTVTRVYAGAGDDASDTVLAVEPLNLYTVYMTLEEDAYESADTLYVSTGETVYLKCTENGNHIGEGVVTETDGLEYTVLCTGGVFSNGETVYAYRDAEYSKKQKLGIGTVIATDADMYSGSGIVTGIYVENGDSIEAGQLLFEYTDGDTGSEWNDGIITAGTSGVVTGLNVSADAKVSKGDTVAILCTSYKAEFSVPEDEVSDLSEGEEVELTLDDDTVFSGNIEMISYIADDEGMYDVYVSLPADMTELRSGMNVDCTVMN